MNTNTNKVLEINRVPLSRMLKSEVAEYARRVIGIIDKEYVHTTSILPLVDKLNDTDGHVEMLGIRYGIDPMREIIANYKSQMMLSVTELKLKAHIIGKTNNDEDLQIINKKIDTYFKKFAQSKNDKEVSNKIKGFLNEIDVNEELFNALEKHKLNAIVSSIKLAKMDFDYSWNKRVQLLSERSKMKTKEIVDIVYTAITNLFNVIEVAHLINPEEDHTALALELSQLSDLYNTSIAIRRANNKRKLDREKEREEGKENPEGEENTEGENGTEPMATAMRLHSTSEDQENQIKPFAVMVNQVNDDEADVANEDENEDNEDNEDTVDYD